MQIAWYRLDTARRILTKNRPANIPPPPGDTAQTGPVIFRHRLAETTLPPGA